MRAYFVKLDPVIEIAVELVRRGIRIRRRIVQRRKLNFTMMFFYIFYFMTVFNVLWAKNRKSGKRGGGKSRIGKAIKSHKTSSSDVAAAVAVVTVAK